MVKGQDAKKTTKKKAVRTLKEKRIAKKDKKTTSFSQESHGGSSDSKETGLVSRSGVVTCGHRKENTLESHWGLGTMSVRRLITIAYPVSVCDKF